jgi:hypothetical protein
MQRRRVELEEEGEEEREGRRGMEEEKEGEEEREGRKRKRKRKGKEERTETKILKSSKEDLYKKLKIDPRPPNKTWNDPEKVRNFFKNVAEALHLKTPDDWYRVAISQIHDLGGICFFFFCLFPVVL